MRADLLDLLPDPAAAAAAAVTRQRSPVPGLALAAVVFAAYIQFGPNTDARSTAVAVPRRVAVQGVTCAMLPAGIRAQESGGNYRARSSVGAAGAYQVMPGNLPAWSLEAVGRRVALAEFLGSRELQDRIARRKIGEYCARYGPRGAAAAWFSGRPELHRDYRYRGGGAASVGAYVDSVMALSRRAAR